MMDETNRSGERPSNAASYAGVAVAAGGSRISVTFRNSNYIPRYLISPVHERLGMIELIMSERMLGNKRDIRFKSYFL